MPQSLSKLYTHLVFGTKYRKPLIKDNIRSDLHAYIAGLLYNLDCLPIKINSVGDHIHILFILSKNYSLAKVVEEVKKSSSKWMKDNGVSNFSWQRGYGAFSVSSSTVEIVERYIENQQRHHRSKSFMDELEEYMRGYGVLEYDRRYFWD